MDSVFDRPRFRKPPNWNLWRYMPEVETWQACALALNIDPDSLERPEQELMCPPSDGFLTKSFPSYEDADNFEKLLRLLHANRETKHFTPVLNVHDPVRLCEFAAWCTPVVLDLFGCDIPKELAALAKDAKQILPAEPKVSNAPPPITPLRGGGYSAKRAVEVQRKPATAPDWAYWPAARPVKPWQAVALSLNLEPESLEHSSTAWMAGPGAGPIFKSESFPDAETEATFRKRLALLGDFFSHSSSVPLGVLAGKLVAHTMPPEITALLIDVPAATGKPTDTPAAKVEAAPADDHDETLAALFDPVPVEALEKMFPADGKWKSWAEKAKANGLIIARVKTAMFNPYKAGVWFIRKGATGWDDAHLYRTLVKNLPARSLDEASQLTGGID